MSLKIWRIIAPSIVALWLLNACADEGEVPDVSHIPVKLTLVRLEEEIARISSQEEAKQFLDKYPAFANTFLFRHRWGDDAVPISDMLRLGQSQYIDTLVMEAKAYFGDMADIRRELEQAFRMLKYYYPEFREPVIYTIVTGYSNDLTLTDSAIFIGLDYFMGTASRYHSPDPHYIFKHYRKELVVPAIILMLSANYNQINQSNQTMLNQMITYGKAYEFTSRILPHVPDSLIIRYTAKEIEDCYDNQHIIWAHFVKNNLFFETSLIAAKRYIEQRPHTFEIGDECPGRVGTWLGWQIVRAYMKNHPEITLQQLMAERDVQKIFETSGYRPPEQ
ncbi:MAG: gliding motility lipoprotein GldB [Cytophagales bacterium]|nr:gliding motility lipoprotein GldB [Bernardetiaceae bacterium]MDW8211686.1 gliding motility lipoprotein GldB [Cytophagales bacterium]